MVFKSYCFIAAIILLASCKGEVNGEKGRTRISPKDTVVIHDTVYINNNESGEWQKGFGLTHDPDKDSIWGKPVSYYLDETCSPLAYDFYYGYSYIKPSDNGVTEEILKLACTNDTKLRPFYRWCLDKIITLSDGALSELVGVPARQYAEQFPDEFFEYLDIDPANDKYKMWTEAIQYSGYSDYPDYDNRNLQNKELIKRMTRNLKEKSAGNIQRIEKFAKDSESL